MLLSRMSTIPGMDLMDIQEYRVGLKLDQKECLELLETLKNIRASSLMKANTASQTQLKILEGEIQGIDAQIAKVEQLYQGFTKLLEKYRNASSFLSNPSHGQEMRSIDRYLRYPA